MTGDARSLRARREQILLRMLLRITRHMTVETVSRVQARGFAGMQPAYPRLLGNLDTEGTRIGALARRMGTTRQAAAQLAGEVERAGFVVRRADPHDGRGVVVRFTAKGHAALASAIAVMAEIEAEYAATIGKAALRRLKSELAALLAEIDDAGALGPD
jgi:DNA-binding MarR family transcriptional regulator